MIIVGYCGFCETALYEEAPGHTPGRRRSFHSDSCRQKANRFAAKCRSMVAFVVFTAHGRPWPTERPRPLGAPVLEKLVREVMDAW